VGNGSIIAATRSRCRIPDAVVFYHIWWTNLGVLFNSFLLMIVEWMGEKGG
jgi:hypothetical protein